MQIEARKYGLLDLIKIPIQAAPAAAILVGLHSILAGIIPTIHVLVTADFIDTAIGILQGSLARSEIYSSLFAVVVLIAYSWVAAALANLINVKFDLGLQRHYHTAVMEKRARLHYRHIENPETWDLISRVTSRPEAQLTGGYRLLISAAAEILRIMGVLGILISQVWWYSGNSVVSVPLFALAVKAVKPAMRRARKRRNTSARAIILPMF